ncbi:hypothetical protein LCGC14_2193690 [marine sediment metagenome]|uniref:Uncharacterized protein n=1 Tax=marine sediment metagenome TaxID=412755 RepID=A0A0F9E5U9_9ZZZZ
MRIERNAVLKAMAALDKRSGAAQVEESRLSNTFQMGNRVIDLKHPNLMNVSAFANAACQLYMDEDKTFQEIADLAYTTEDSIEQILERNLETYLTRVRYRSRHMRIELRYPDKVMRY